MALLTRRMHCIGAPLPPPHAHHPPAASLPAALPAAPGAGRAQRHSCAACCARTPPGAPELAATGSCQPPCARARVRVLIACTVHKQERARARSQPVLMHTQLAWPHTLCARPRGHRPRTHCWACTFAGLAEPGGAWTAGKAGRCWAGCLVQHGTCRHLPSQMAWARALQPLALAWDTRPACSRAGRLCTRTAPTQQQHAPGAHTSTHWCVTPSSVASGSWMRRTGAQVALYSASSVLHVWRVVGHGAVRHGARCCYWAPHTLGQPRVPSA